MCKLTGMPSLENLYLSSCISHYSQVIEMCNLGWLDNIVKYTRGKLRYIDTAILKGRFSVLKALISNVNICVGSRRAKLKFSSSNAFLVQLESICKNISYDDVRILQRCLTLSIFGKINSDFTRKRLSSGTEDFLVANQSLIDKHTKKFKKIKLQNPQPSLKFL